jgi:AraC-like DNA-binding protein
MMQPARDRDDFVKAPIGKYLAGGTWLYFYASAHFSGFLLWGRLNEEDLQETIKIKPSVHAFAATPHVAMVDARRVEKVDAAAFAVTAGYVQEHRVAIGKVIDRLAVLHPPGLLGTIAGGFFQIVRPPYPVEVFAEPTAALRWLGLEGAGPLMAELDALQAKVSGTTPVLRDLRALIHRNLRGVALPEAATSLGISERSLQRRLSEHGTSFQRELGLARVRAAQGLLVETEASLTHIAFEVGCASLHHFSLLFRKVTGETPSQWRARYPATPES